MADQAQKPADVANPQDTKPLEVKPDAASGQSADAVKPDVKSEAGANQPDQKPDEKKAEAPGAPDKYDLKVPENSLLSDAHVDALKAYAKEKGYSNDEAQLLLEREHNAGKASIETISHRQELQAQEWLKQAKADKEIGGDNFPKTVELANHALNSLFPGVEIRKFMDDTGFGNNPVVLRGFAKIGKMLRPDAIVQPQGQPPMKKDPVRTMYDHPTSQQSKS